MTTLHPAKPSYWHGLNPGTSLAGTARCKKKFAQKCQSLHEPLTAWSKTNLGEIKLSNEVVNTVNDVAETVAATAVPAQKAANAGVKAFHTTVGVTKRFSPQILLGIGVVGVVAAGVLACKATLKLEEVVSKAEAEIADVKDRRSVNEFDTETEFNKALAKVYIDRTYQVVKLYTPALSVATVGIGCLLGSYGVLNQRNVASIAAYQTLSSGFEQYRRRVVEDLGEDKDKEYRYGLVEREVPQFDEDGNKVGTKKLVEATIDGDGYAREFDEGNELWSRVPGMNRLTLTNQQNWLNDRLNKHGYLFLNDVYKALGFPQTSGGQVVGWLSEGHRNFDGATMDGYIDLGLDEIEKFGKDGYVDPYEGTVLLDFNVDGMMNHLI
jgi:hypothetical protein